MSKASETRKRRDRKVNDFLDELAAAVAPILRKHKVHVGIGGDVDDGDGYLLLSFEPTDEDPQFFRVVYDVESEWNETEESHE